MAVKTTPRMTHARYLVASMTAVIAVGLVSACATGDARGPSGGLQVATASFDRDIPVPRGFRMTEQVSEGWSNGSARYLRHQYVGRADKRGVREFYRREMPLVRWTPVDESSVHGRISMRFHRGSESCTINIEDLRGGWSRRVAVGVLIVPSNP